MAETRSAAIDQAAPDDLISFLKAIPVGEANSEGVGRYPRGVRYPQWFLLLVTVLATSAAARAPVIWRPLPNATVKP